MSDSLAKQISRLPLEAQIQWIEGLEHDLRLELAKNPWWFVGRPEQQLPPGLWRVWLQQAGRGWGKTRSGAENFVYLVLENPVDESGAPTEWAVIAETFSDCRKICVEGPSGIRRVLRNRGFEENVHYVYNRSQWQIIFTTGQVIHMLGADTPDVGRGLNLAGLWADEVGKWRYSYEIWHEGVGFALRIGNNPRAIVTTTPKPGHRLLKEWAKADDGSVVITRGSIYDNADNLSAAQLKAFKEAYEGTRLWRQEGLGELLEDVPGSLWVLENILHEDAPMEWKRRVVAIDPAVTNTETSDETGIIVCGKALDNRLAVIADYSCKDTIFGYASRALEAFRIHNCDLIVYEDNQGGTAVAEILHSIDPYAPVKAVKAYVGKKLRAEPIASLYEQHKVFHVKHYENGHEVRHLAKLEDQMLSWAADDPKSPDRLDAMVHGLTELAGTAQGSRFLTEIAEICERCQMPNPKGSTVCRQCGQGLNPSGRVPDVVNQWSGVNRG